MFEVKRHYDDRHKYVTITAVAADDGRTLAEARFWPKETSAKFSVPNLGIRTNIYRTTEEAMTSMVTDHARNITKCAS